MKEKIKNYLLHTIAEEWKFLSSDSQPSGVWIRYFAPISPDIDELKSISEAPLPLQVWFLDKNGIRERSLWEHRRYITVHFERPWCSRYWEEDTFWGGGRHEIGQATFALYQDSADAYVEWQWGGRHGYGQRIAFDKNGVAVDVKGLWIS